MIELVPNFQVERVHLEGMLARISVDEDYVYSNIYFDPERRGQSKIVARYDKEKKMIHIEKITQEFGIEVTEKEAWITKSALQEQLG